MNGMAAWAKEYDLLQKKVLGGSAVAAANGEE